ncbi:MAG TPA: deoxyribose-phosphate aldolase, partial [Bacteroidales bacterium]|nr:deoxyribose-phosphate aldolase [Bacteroidales bacterium]
GKKVGFKPAGGIANTPVALQYASVVKSILGNDWLNNHLFRIGASSLANSVLNDVLQIENPGFAEIKYF